MRSYRNRRGGKRRNEHNRSVLTVVLLILFTVAVVVGTVLLGRYLGEKSARSRELRETDSYPVFGATEADPSLAEESFLSDKAPVGISSEFFSLSAVEDIDALREASDALPETAAVTVIMRSASGRLMYSSSAAAAIGGKPADDPLPTASDVIGTLKEKNRYVSAVVSISAAGENEVENSAVRAFERAMINEIALAGADEVIFFCPSLTSDGAAELGAFADDLRDGTLGTAKLGIMLDTALLDGDDASRLCRSLAEHFEVLALDMSGLSAVTAESLTSRVQVFLARYNARIFAEAGAEIPDELALDRTARISVAELLDGDDQTQNSPSASGDVDDTPADRAE